jgi:hypothetical protein
VKVEDVYRIAAMEANYWGEVEDERLLAYALGAMGAASNICAAVMREVTPEQFQSEIEQRRKGNLVLGKEVTP